MGWMYSYVYLDWVDLDDVFAFRFVTDLFV